MFYFGIYIYICIIVCSISVIKKILNSYIGHIYITFSGRSTCHLLKLCAVCSGTVHHIKYNQNATNNTRFCIWNYLH